VDRTAFASGGGSGTVNVSTNRECAWSAKSDAAWVTVTSQATGQGAGTVNFTVAANANASARSAGITVNDQRVQISQEAKPCEFTVSSNRETVDGAGTDRTIDVRASAAQCGWTAVSNVAWITIVSGREGTGNGSVTFHAEAVSGPPRSGTITVAGQQIQIDQGTGCSYAIGTDTFTVDAGGGDRQVPVTAPAGCAWTSESRTPWITLTSGGTGSGPGVVGFRVAATDGPARTGTLVVAGRTVTVSQGVGCAASISPSSVNVNAQGGSSNIQLETGGGCPWSAASSASWISVTPANGNGRATVQINVAANTGPARTGTATIAGQTVTIAQASGCAYSTSPTSFDMPGPGGSGAVSLTTGAGCAWTASSAANWIALSATSGNGPGQVSLSVAANASPPRNGTVTVAGQTVTVNQASECTWVFLPPSADFDADGGLGSVLVIVTGSCTWTASSTVDWIRVTLGSSGSGNGLLQFVVSPNGGAARSGGLAVAGQTYIVNQRAR
jgi:hypothetical protein